MLVVSLPSMAFAPPLPPVVVPPKPIIEPPPDPALVAHSKRVDMVHGIIAPRIDKLDDDESRELAETIVAECEATGVDPLFVIAIIDVESRWDIEAVSPTGAKGLMQIVPSTFRLMSTAKRMFDPQENVRAGIRYIRRLWDSGFGRRGPESILLAYNQGPGVAVTVYRDGTVIPDEAAFYIPRVMAKYRALLAEQGRSPRDAKTLFLLATR